MQNITVFCSASDIIDPIYKHEAEVLGHWIGTHQRTLVYGGANGGLMEIVARAAREGGSEVVGIITRRIIELGRTSQQPTELITTENMGKRKQLLVKRGDLIVILPGGVGTIDELFDALTTRMLGEHSKPIIICNTQGLFDPMLEQIEHLRRNGFLRYDQPNLYHVAPNAQACCELIEQYSR